MTWWVHAVIDGEVKRYPLDEDGTSLGEPSGPGDPELWSNIPKNRLGRADGLEFTLEGKGPSFDLGVADMKTGARLIVPGLDLTKNSFADIEHGGAVVVVEGERGTDKSSGFLLVPTAQFHEAIASGNTTLDTSSVDYGRMRANQTDIDLEGPPLMLFPVAGNCEVIAITNTPRVNPAVAKLTTIESYYRKGTEAAGVSSAASPTQDLDRFWCVDFDARKTETGVTAHAIGVGRKQKDFVLAVRKLYAGGGADSIRMALTTMEFSGSEHPEVGLRDTGSLKSVSALPDGRGFLIVTEAPTRKAHLYRVDMDEHGTTIQEVEAPGDVQAMHVERTASAAVVEAPVAVAATAAPAASAGAPVASVAPIAGLTKVTSDGASIDLGSFAANAHVDVQVSIVGDGDGADLRWWLAQAGSEAAVAYTMHLISASPVDVRVSTRTSYAWGSALFGR